MIPHADRDRCLHLAARTFCAMGSFCQKRGVVWVGNDKVETGILNFQYISNHKYLAQLVSLFGLRVPRSVDFLPLSLATLSWSLLHIRMPYDSLRGSLLFPTCISLKISSILTVLNSSYAHDSPLFIPTCTLDSGIPLPT